MWFVTFIPESSELLQILPVLTSGSSMLVTFLLVLVQRGAQDPHRSHLCSLYLPFCLLQLHEEPQISLPSN